jgi:hypothetical protein
MSSIVRSCVLHEKPPDDVTTDEIDFRYTFRLDAPQHISSNNVAVHSFPIPAINFFELNTWNKTLYEGMSLDQYSFEDLLPLLDRPLRLVEYPQRYNLSPQK